MKDIFYDERKYMKPVKDTWQDALFELTTYCNLNCPFCLNDSTVTNSEFMSLENFKIMVDKVKNSIQLLMLSGGEPLSNPHILAMLDYLIQNDIAFRISTNGTLMTDEIMDRILCYPKSSIQFSLDGAIAETDDEVRCPGHFNKIISLMTTLNQNGYKKGILKMVINRHNYEQIDDFFFLALKYNFIPTYAFLVKSGRAHKNWDELCIDDSFKCILRDKIRKLMDDNVEYFQQYQSPDLLSYLHNMNIDYVGECQFNLDHFTFSPLILPDGSAQPCQGLQEKEFCIGNLVTQSMDDIYSKENPLLKSLLERVAERRRILDNHKCKTCVLNKMCGKGCIAEAYNKGDFFGPSADCEMRKYDFLKKILKNRDMCQDICEK